MRVVRPSFMVPSTVGVLLGAALVHIFATGLAALACCHAHRFLVCMQHSARDCRQVSPSRYAVVQLCIIGIVFVPAFIQLSAPWCLAAYGESIFFRRSPPLCCSLDHDVLLVFRLHAATLREMALRVKAWG